MTFRTESEVNDWLGVQERVFCAPVCRFAPGLVPAAWIIRGRSY